MKAIKTLAIRRLNKRVVKTAKGRPSLTDCSCASIKYASLRNVVEAYVN